jgi:hypothetical protein
MHGVKLVGSKRLRFHDVVLFDPDDFQLVDIVNDASRTSKSRGFLSDPGAFVYDMEFSFDARRMQDERVKSVRMELFLTSPTIAKLPKQTERSRDDHAKYEHQERINELNRRSVKPILVQDLDLEVPLPNDSVQSDGVKRETLHSNLIGRTDLILNAPLKTQTRELPHAMTAFVPPTKLVTNAPSSKKTSMVRRDNLRNSGVDPAKMGQSFTPSLPTLEGLRNVGKGESAPHYDPYGREEAGLKPLASMEMTARSSLHTIRKSALQSLAVESLRSTTTRLAQSLDRIRSGVETVGSESVQSVELGNQVRIESYVKTKKFRLEVDKALVGSKKQLFIRMTPVLTDSRAAATVLIEPAIFQVLHGDQVRKLVTPKVPPRMERVQNTGSKTSFRITQMDPIASKVIVLKRIITPDPFDEEPSLFFDEIDLGYGEDSITLIDENANNWLPNQVIYTAMAQHEGQDGPFDSLVFDGIPCPFARSSNQDDGTTKLSIVATNSFEGVEIRIGRIPENVTMLTLCREQLNANGPKRLRTSIIRNSKGAESTSTVGGTDGLNFFDDSVKSNGKYRYFCVLTLRGGQRVESNDDEITIRRATRDKLPLDVELYQPTVRQEESDLFTVSMDLLTRQKSSTFQYVKELLGEQAASQEFLEEIEKNRDELTDIMIFYVQRVDLKTGKRAALGFHKSGIFVDDENLANRFSVPNVTPGRRYVYSFTACLVPPSTFLSGVFNRLSTGNRLGVKDIEYLANKFDNYVIRNFGVLPSNAQLIKKLDAEQLILRGNTGISYDVEIEVPIPIDVIRDVNFEDSKVGTKVSWSLSRSVNDLVDYCNVFVTVNGNKELIGSVRNSGISSSMYHIDDRYHLSIGTRSYSIIAVFYDGSSSIEVQSQSIERLSNTSPKLLKGLLTSGKILGLDAPKNLKTNVAVPIKTTIQASDIIKNLDFNLGANLSKSNLNLNPANTTSTLPNSINISPVAPASAPLQFNKVLPNASPTFNGNNKLVPKKIK